MFSTIGKGALWLHEVLSVWEDKSNNYNETNVLTTFWTVADSLFYGL